MALTVFLITWAGLLLFYHQFVRPVQDYQSPGIPEDETKLPPVSVVVCAHNEHQNLKAYLPQVLRQYYPEFEVIVVNDCSTDKTQEVLEKLSEQFSHLRIIQLCQKPSDVKGKKHPLQKGIDSARYQSIVVTDADCYPQSRNWLRYMAAPLREYSIVLGYSPYQSTRGWLNRFIRYDGFWVALQYISFTLQGWPYMGVGRNMAFRKSLFQETTLDKLAPHQPSGDDDLFVNQQANTGNTVLQLAPSSFMLTPAKSSWTSFYQQKLRHISTGLYYHWRHQIMLGGLAICQLGLYSSFLFLLVDGNPDFFGIAILGFIGKIALQYQVFYKGMKRLHVGDLWKDIALWDFFSLIFYILLSVGHLLKPRVQW